MTARTRNLARLRELGADDTGQAVTEWTILTATVVLPLSWVGWTSVQMLNIYFYRVAGLISLPFP